MTNKHDFGNQFLSNVSFENQDVSGADFSFSHLENINFKNANLENSNFTNSSIQGCDFYEAILTKSDFANSSIGASNVKLLKTLLFSVFISAIFLLFSSESSEGAFSYSKRGKALWIETYMSVSLVLIVSLVFTIYSTLSLKTFSEGYFLYVCLLLAVVYLLSVNVGRAFLLAKEVSQTCFCKSDLTQSSFKNAEIKEVTFAEAILVDVKW
jgi:uncharacterized protein YjbI with pentapeptide repeats